MCLMHAFAGVAPQKRWEVRVGHVNHGLRGSESDSDAAFVRAQAATLGLDCDVAQVDTRAEATRRPASLEMAARVLRRDALVRMLTEWRGHVIATGHTADDQVETILLRLLRGTGTRGLGGMGGMDGVIARPFLGLGKSDILREARAQGIMYREDSSNQDDRILRNAVRRRVVPALKSLQPGLLQVVGRTAHVVRADADLIAAVVDEVSPHAVLNLSDSHVTLSIPVLTSLHASLAAHVIASAVRFLGAGDMIDAELLTTLARPTPFAFARWTHIRQNLWVHVDRDRLDIAIGRESFAAPNAVMLPGPGSVSCDLGTLAASSPPALEVGSARAVLGPLHALIHADAIRWPLRVRSRQPGDRLSPATLGGTKKLQDIFVDRKIPRDMRDRIAVVEDAIGVLWVPGIARDSRTQLASGSQPVLHLQFTPSDPCPW